MGRGKIEIKKIENTTNRGVTFSKRKNGIFKKAYELSLLCDAHVFIVTCSSSGKVQEYCSPKTSLPQLLEEYQDKTNNILWDVEHKNMKKEIEDMKKENDAMEIELRHLKGLDIGSLHYTELMNIERDLQEGINAVSYQKMERRRMQEVKIEFLVDEHYRLIYKLQEMEMAGKKERDMENPYEEYPVKEPFAFGILHPNFRHNM